MKAMPYVGKHAMLDLRWEPDLNAVCFANNSSILMNAMERAVLDEGATILARSVNDFPGENSDFGGFTGMLVLSESHASVHTWPEYSLATLDVYMCGSCDAFECIQKIVNYLGEAGYAPTHKFQTKIYRGFHHAI